MKNIKILCLILSVFLSSCGHSCDDSNNERSGLNQFSDRMLQWQGNQIVSYKLTYYIECLCINNTNEITVNNNEITKIEILTREGDLVREIPSEEYSEYYTINTFFEEIKKLNEVVDVLKVEYNSSLGYPTVIDVDPYSTRCDCNGRCSETVDDEYTYNIDIVINS